MTQEIVRLVGERAAALVAQDWAVVDAQLHPRFVYTNSQGKRLTKAAYVDFLSSGPLRWRKQWLEDATVVHDRALRWCRHARQQRRPAVRPVPGHC